MSQVKFQKLIDDFSPSSLAEIFTGQGLFAIQQNPLPSLDDKQFIEFNHLGDFKLEDDANIVVACARSLAPLNERASRKTQYDLGKKILKNFPKARAGIFVYYDSKGDFRMSLIYADYVGTKVNYSTFRRFTYFVSKQQKNVTFLQQVASLKFTNFKELKELFSVEKVTKEFFKNYRQLFIEILEDFEENIEFQNIVVKTGISTTSDFVKKLMGQIVFLYFVQKKGWLGVPSNKNWGEGDSSYLRTLFETCKKTGENFFNDYLEHLFYKALATEERDENGCFEKFNCRIPFLNGGLFEKTYEWENSKINIHNEVLGKLLDFFDQYNFTVDENTPSDQEISVDPEMLGKIFENLLEVKDRKDKGAFYTPREIVHYMCRESLIQHLVSEDTAPEERIRKIFEIKDTDLSVLVDDDKKTETIKRMQELKDIAEKVDVSLRNVKIVDPAVGSGAFPMGILNEISSVRYYLNTNFLHKANDTGKELSLYDIKKETLENCIYAVDLEPGAVEITKLRFWLALIVEFESNDPKIAPPVLPNLDYKIMQGNSLLEEYEGVKLFDENIIKTVDTDKEKQIEDLKKKQSVLQKEYLSLNADNKLTPIKKVELDTEAKNIHDQLKKLTKIEKVSIESSGLFDFDKNKESKLKADKLKSLQKEFFETNKKESIKKEIEKLEWELIEATLTEQGKESELSKIAEFKKSKTKPFFLWKLHFADVFEQKGGFDIVIGNPPYVGEKGNKEIFEPLKKSYLGDRFYIGKMDLFYFFFHLGLDILKNKGISAFITTNYYITATGAKKLISDIEKRSTILSLINFNEMKIFESALGQHNMITILQKGNLPIDAKISYTNRKGYLNDSQILLNIFNKSDSETVFHEIPQSDIYDDGSMRLTSSATNPIDAVLNKIQKDFSKLGEICDINQGLKSNADYVMDKHLERYPSLKEIKGTGIFILNKKEIGNLKFNEAENAFLKPLYKNSDIEHYIASSITDYFVLYITRKNYVDKYLHPNLFNYLNRFKMILMDRAEVEPNGVIPLYALTRPRNELMYEGEKIVAPYKTGKGNCFAYSNSSWYASGDVYFISQLKNIDYLTLLGILNSKLIYIWLSRKGKRKGNIFELYTEPLSKIPIPKISSQNNSDALSIQKLVDQIISIKKVNLKAETSNLEHQIDVLVYKLYDLMPEEIEIVENSSKK